METPKPTPAHERLAALAGSWSGAETMQPSPWDPNGSTATGFVESRIDFDGLLLITDYRQERDGQVTFRGHGVYGYDPKQDRYSMYWFDSMSQDPAGAAYGTWEGDTLTFERKSEMGTSRYVYTLKGPDACAFRIEMSRDGRDFTAWMESTLARR